jgi:(1->4)-alpha-D-glucan 1-alpha-D-glucosylmutase
VLAEKILARGERLPTSWAIHGTTGYEFLNLVGGLFVASGNERRLTRIHAAFTGRPGHYADLVYEAKQLIMDVAMSSELNVLGHALNRLSERDRYSRDFTLNSLTDALKEVIACFPVYRTYVDGRAPEIALQDRACIEVAVAFAKRRNPAKSPLVFDFVRDVLLLRYPEHADEDARRDQLAFVRKFQQVTAPVTAKGVEDTAFYRYHRLASLNEVGGDPDRFGVSVQEFHAQCRVRQETWPDGLSATATHDTKRGEDVRVRIHVLSEVPQEWRAAVTRWRRWNRGHLTRLDGQPAPDPSDEYLLYQTLVGAWPQPDDPADHAEFTTRIQAYMRKAAREAKVHTSWISPNEAYETALEEFVARLLDPAPGNRFLEDLMAFQGPVARLGAVNSLSQCVLKITAPGVPDFYQGTELWDLSLVDPDNRRAVDFGRRQGLLDALTTRLTAGDPGPLAAELLAGWTDGRVKLYAIHRALACRRGDVDLFRQGAYTPLPTLGVAADHVCAFARTLEGRAVLTIVPRLCWSMTGGGARWPVGDLWGDTRVALPDAVPAGAYRDWLTGRTHEPRGTEAGPMLAIADVLAEFPVALLERLTATPVAVGDPGTLSAAEAERGLARG